MAYSRSVTDYQQRRAAARPAPNARPFLVSPKVARLMGLGDYTQVNPTTGALVTYAGSPPTSNPYPNGALLAASGAPGAIYLVVNGVLQGFPDYSTLQAMGYTYDDITFIPGATLVTLPKGPNLPEQAIATVPVPPITQTPVASTTSTVVSTGNYVATTPTYTATLEAGAVYNAATGTYTNPDGTIYDPSLAASSSSTVDITEPSTWPTWVWLALAAGGTWLLFLRRR